MHYKKRGHYKPRRFSHDPWIRDASMQVRRMRDVDAGERLVLYCLASHVNQYGSCWPSRETIAQETSMTVRGVIRILKRLEKKRTIYRVSQGGVGLGSCARYEWRTVPSREVADAATEHTLEIIASLSDPPQPGSFEEWIAQRPNPQTSTPVTKLATDLRTTLMRIKSRRRILGTDMSTNLRRIKLEMMVRAGIESEVAI